MAEPDNYFTIIYLVCVASVLSGRAAGVGSVCIPEYKGASRAAVGAIYIARNIARITR